MDIVDNCRIDADKTAQNMQAALAVADELMHIPQDKRFEVLCNSFVGIEIIRIEQNRIVTYKGKAFQVKSTGEPKRIEEIYHPLAVEDLQNFLLSYAVYNKVMRENRQ